MAASGWSRKPKASTITALGIAWSMAAPRRPRSRRGDAEVLAYARGGSGAPALRAFIVLSGDGLARVVLEESSGDERDDGAGGDIPGDGIGRLVLGVEPSGDERRRAAGDDLSDLVAQGRAAVTQPAGGAIGDERGLRSVHHVVRDEPQQAREEDQSSRPGLQHRDIDQAED